MDDAVRKYLATIGANGGRKSRRSLSCEEARLMAKVRDARRAYKKFHARCFWSYRPDLKITAEDLPWISRELMKQGGREAWSIGARLCP